MDTSHIALPFHYCDRHQKLPAHSLAIYSPIITIVTITRLDGSGGAVGLDSTDSDGAQQRRGSNTKAAAVKACVIPPTARLL